MNKSPGFAHIGLIFVLLLIAIVGYFVLNNMSWVPFLKYVPLTEPEGSPPSILLLKKVHVDLSKKLFDDVDFPKEITDLKDEDLLEFGCRSQETMEHMDKELLSSIERIANQQNLQSPSENLFSATLCEVKDNESFVHYKNSIIKAEDGLIASQSFFNLTSDVGKKDPITFEQDSNTYFSCHTPIVLTNNYELYILCGGGDGPYGTTSIHKIDFKNNSSERIIFCEDFTPDYESDDAYSRCAK